MKRNLTTLLIVLMAIAACAQDIIVTTEADRINAKIIELSQYEVVYKHFSDLEGPTFNLPLNKIVTILYEDGRVSVFSNKLDNPELYDHVIRQPLLPGLITKQEDSYLLAEDNQTTKMSQQAYLKFIENNCPEAWQSYQKGEKIWSLGWRFFGSGLCLEAIGIALLFSGAHLDGLGGSSNHLYGTGMKLTGVIMMAGGGVCTVASIPLLSVGSVKRNRSHEVYNDCYLLQNTENTVTTKNQRKRMLAPSTPLTLNLQATSNGIGLALQF